MTSGRSDQGDLRQQIQQQVYAALLDKIRDDRFPSPTMMNMVEEGMTDEQAAEYVDALLDKVRNDRFPSIDMLKRLINLT